MSRPNRIGQEGRNRLQVAGPFSVFSVLSVVNAFPSCAKKGFQHRGHREHKRKSPKFKQALPTGTFHESLQPIRA